MFAGLHALEEWAVLSAHAHFYTDSNVSQGCNETLLFCNEVRGELIPSVVEEQLRIPDLHRSAERTRANARLDRWRLLELMSSLDEPSCHSRYKSRQR